MVSDGAKPNRKFFNSLGVEKTDMKNGIVYRTVNRYCHERYIYLMSDVPHLIKTTRNCWYSSKSGGARYMWVSYELNYDFVYIIIINWHRNFFVPPEKWKTHPLGSSP